MRGSRESSQDITDIIAETTEQMADMQGSVTTLLIDKIEQIISASLIYVVIHRLRDFRTSRQSVEGVVRT